MEKHGGWAQDFTSLSEGFPPGAPGATTLLPSKAERKEGSSLPGAAPHPCPCAICLHTIVSQMLCMPLSPGACLFLEFGPRPEPWASLPLPRLGVQNLPSTGAPGPTSPLPAPRCQDCSTQRTLVLPALEQGTN